MHLPLRTETVKISQTGYFSHIIFSHFIELANRKERLLRRVYIKEKTCKDKEQNSIDPTSLMSVKIFHS